MNANCPPLRFAFCLPVLAAAALLTAVPPAYSQEDDTPGSFAEPSIVNPSWAFELDVRTPQAIAVPDDRGAMRWYWYAPYTVTNNTGRDRLFIPQVVVLDNLGRIVTAGRQIPPNVFPAIAERLGNDLLERPDDVIGRLLQGEDFARDSVAIWPASSRDVDEFTLFFAGADGETQPLIDPITGEPITQAATDPITGAAVLDEAGNPVQQTVMVRRNRAFTYATPGTLGRGANLREQPVTLLEEFVVMR
ncbi:MAG: hypothetical protein AAF800_07845 [Planctomycetota bacterium]